MRPTDERIPRRVVAVSVGTAFVVLTVSLALVFAGATGTQRISENARDLHWTNSALGSISLARAASAQAVFFGVDRAIDVVSDDAFERALDEARRTLEAIGAIEAVAPQSRVDLAGDLASFRRLGESVVSTLEAGEVSEALELNQSVLEAAFVDLRERLSAEQSLIEERISSTESAAGRIAMAAQFFVTLLVPILALIVYRWIVSRQVRERRIVLEAKLRAERELNRAKDEFIAGLSHEFRTPLTSIYGFSEVLLESGLIDPAASLEMIGLINNESAELSRMVEDLLIAARLESEALTIKPEVVDPSSEISQVIDPWVRSGVPITIDVGEAQVWADPLRLRQVVRNLVSNAIKHGGDRITVEAATRGPEFVCSVVDDGEGVPADIQERLFQRYVHDGKEAILAGSVGLGLNIARSLCEEMGGSLEYEHVAGETRFTMRLPAQPTEIAGVRSELISATS